MQASLQGMYFTVLSASNAASVVKYWTLEKRSIPFEKKVFINEEIQDEQAVC